MHEADLDKLAGMRLQLEVQVNTLESANINANTLDVMRRGANALKDIHNGLCVAPALTHTCTFSWLIPTLIPFFFPSNIDKVDATMSSVNEQRDIANEISDAISTPANIGFEFDEVRRVGGSLSGLRRNSRWLCRTSLRRNWGNSSRRISTSDFWAPIMCQCTPQRARAALKCGIKRQRSTTRMQNSRHCRPHLQCRDSRRDFRGQTLPCLFITL